MSTILLDVDGVLNHFLPFLLASMDSYSDTASNLTVESFKTWDLNDTFTEDQKNLSMFVMSQPSFWKNIPASVEAQDVVAELQKKHDVCFVTSPYKDCFGWADVRRDWILEHFFDPNDKEQYKKVYIASDKSRVVGDFFMDDKPSNVTSWSLCHGGLSYLFGQPYNKIDHHHVRRSWSDVATLFKLGQV